MPRRSISENLPPPLMTSEPGSFARSTIVSRKPQIIREVIAGNTYPQEILQALSDFTQEIANSPIRPVLEDSNDTEFWNTQLALYPGCTWLEVPWYFAETFFYRRLLEATAYFQPGAWSNVDPFTSQKIESISTGVEWFDEAWSHFRENDPKLAFEVLLHSSLWGNRADLSNFTVEEQARGGLAALNDRHLILIDNTHELLSLVESGLRRVDFINDNVGKELLFDLALADFLLALGWVSQVVFRLKDRPFFVSDAMPKDVLATLEQLQHGHSPSTRQLAQRLSEFHHTGQLLFVSDPFFTSCLMYRQMPSTLTEELAKADLVILKGDVNYRRLLDDLHWSHTMAMEDITGYFPAPFAVLRTLKGEIMVSLSADILTSLWNEDPEWLINGKRGVIQLVSKIQED